MNCEAWSKVGGGGEAASAAAGGVRLPAAASPSRRLTLGGMLEAAVLDGAQQLGLEQEVLEAAAVDAHVALLHLQRPAGHPTPRSATALADSRPRGASSVQQQAPASCRRRWPSRAPAGPPWLHLRPSSPRRPPHSPGAACGRAGERAIRRDGTRAAACVQLPAAVARHHAYLLLSRRWVRRGRHCALRLSGASGGGACEGGHA